VLEALDAPYLQRALGAGMLLSLPLGLVGSWVVLRGHAFFAHAVGVATFPGVVAGVAVPALGPFGGALAAAAAFTAAVSTVEADERLRGGATTGLALATALAGGSLLASATGAGVAADAALFGSLLAVSAADVVRCTVAAGLALAVVGLAHSRLAAATFDPEWAAAAGTRVAPVRLLVLGLAALVVVCALPVVGSLLVSGLLVVPAATARLVTRRAAPMAALAVVICTLELLGGLSIARGLDLPPGPTVAVLSGLGFGLVLGGAFVHRRRLGRSGRETLP
jgi:ABC-type Mn2+/Zn2+ transport system permease subunit